VLDEKQLGALLMGAEDGGSVFRFEGLRQYTVGSDGGDYERYVKGLPGPTMTRKQGWLDLLRKESGRGVHWHRVRLLQPPLSDYERYACEWGYAYNTAAGDDCRILDTSEVALPLAEVSEDFWLVDSDRAAVMHYDDEGHYLGADITRRVGPYVAARDALWEAAEPFYSWWDRHPENHRQLRAA
jgi:hypothetical protein